MTAVDVVPVSEWLSLGAQRPVVRCPGTGAGGRRCLARLLVCGMESGVVRPVWRALEHVPGCDRAGAWGDGPGAAGWWCIEGPEAGRGVGVMPEGVRAVVEGLEVSGLPEGVTCAQTTVVRWGLEWGLDGGEVAWRVGSDPGRWVVSTAGALGAELGEAWERHLGRVVACREVCERAAGLARTVGADLAGLPVVVDAWGGSCELGVRSPSGRQVRVLVPSPDGPVEARLGWEPWVEGLGEVAVADLVRSVP